MVKYLKKREKFHIYPGIGGGGRKNSFKESLGFMKEPPKT
jgi:hypothetical protein